MIKLNVKQAIVFAIVAVVFCGVGFGLGYKAKLSTIKAIKNYNLIIAGSKDFPVKVDLPITKNKVVINRESETGIIYTNLPNQFSELAIRLIDPKTGRVIDNSLNQPQTTLRIRGALLPKIINEALVGRKVGDTIRIIMTPASYTTQIGSIFTSNLKLNQGAIMDIKIVAAEVLNFNEKTK